MASETGKLEKGDWLLPFKERQHSGAYNQNFLWQSGSVYVMDNHKAALWCWFQHLRDQDKIGLLHIDRHTDTLYSRIDEWKANIPDMWSVSLSEYLKKEYRTPEGVFPVMRWDNYLSLFLECFPHLIKQFIMATHEDRDKPRYKDLRKVKMDIIPANVDYWLAESNVRWIVNVDLDYFFFKCDETYYLLTSLDYLRILFEVLKKRIDSGNIAVLTIALSPEFCGGWDNAEQLCALVCKHLSVDFKLKLV